MANVCQYRHKRCLRSHMDISVTSYIQVPPPSLAVGQLDMFVYRPHCNLSWIRFLPESLVNKNDGKNTSQQDSVSCKVGLVGILILYLLRRLKQHHFVTSHFLSLPITSVGSWESYCLGVSPQPQDTPCHNLQQIFALQN